MASFTGKIYITINLKNNKIYIGLTTCNNNSYIGSGSVLKKAIKKYGKSNFKTEILIDNVESVEKLKVLEDFYINLYNSRNPKIGYNVRPGGLNGGWRHSEESLEKIKNRSNQEDNKERIRSIQKMAVISRIGSHHKKDSKLKSNLTKFGKLRKIKIYDKNQELQHSCDFISEASILTNVSESSIKNNLCGLSKSTRNYIFKYTI